MALSAMIILASLDALTVRLVEAGGAAVTAAVPHKYGATAGENAALATGAMCNVMLVYVDVRGLGRKARGKVMGQGTCGEREGREGWGVVAEEASWGRKPFSFFFLWRERIFGIVGLEQHNEE